MSISAISAGQAGTNVSFSKSAPAGPSGADPFRAVSSPFGMSAQAVAKAVAGGSSLSELAQSKGISDQDLKAALVAGLPEEVRGVDGVDGVDAMIGAVMTQSGPPPGMGGGRPHPVGGGRGGFGGEVTGVLGTSMTPSQSTMLDLLSSLLKTDSTTLADNLSSGTSLVDLLKDSGVEQDQLAAVIESGLLVDAKA